MEESRIIYILGAENCKKKKTKTKNKKKKLFGV